MGQGRRLALTDIHGCARSLKELLYSQIELRQEDELFLLGDYVSKGPDAKGVLDTLAELEESGITLHKLRGNHEDMLLEEAQKFGDIRPYYGVRIQDLGHLKEDHPVGRFMSNLGYYIELDDYLLVHAGFDFNRRHPFKNHNDMVWIRNFNYNQRKAKGKTIVHGHTPTPLSEIKENIKAGSPVICLDAGCAVPDKEPEGLGYLVALDLDTSYLFIQENAEN